MFQQLNSVGMNITGVSPDGFPNELQHAAFIIMNCYNNSKYDLGEGPLNDGFNIADLLYQRGYSVFYTIDSSKNVFLNQLEYFFSHTSKELIIYYVGHGIKLNTMNNASKALFFKDGLINDQILTNSLINNKHKSSKVVLLTDACHSGSIWDLRSIGKRLPNVISIAASTDRQTAKQINTLNLINALREKPDLSAIELRRILRKILPYYCQTASISTTSPELNIEPLFLK